MCLENQLSIRKAKQILRHESKIVIFADEYIQQMAGHPAVVGTMTREGMITWEGYAARALLDVEDSYRTCKNLINGVLHEYESAHNVMRQATFAYTELKQEWDSFWKSDSNDFEIQH